MKLLKEKAKIAAMFTVVLGSEVVSKEKGNEYYFKTTTDGSDVYKSPYGMFKEKLIPNDMKYVLESIYKYESEV